MTTSKGDRTHLAGIRASLGWPLVALSIAACGRGQAINPPSENAGWDGDGSASADGSWLVGASPPTPEEDATGAPSQLGEDGGPGGIGTSLPDAATAPVDAAGDPAVAECLHFPTGIYVVATGGYAGLSGASQATGSAGTWIVADSSPSFVQINGPDGGWLFAVAAGLTSPPYGLAPGEAFDSGPGLVAGGAYAQVQADGVSCNGIPTGSFNVVDVAFDGYGESPPLVRLLASFDLMCGDAGRLVGCARYSQ